MEFPWEFLWRLLGKVAETISDFLGDTSTKKD